MRTENQPALLLLLVFLLLATVYNAVVPLGEGPDEPGHIAYVLFLAREGRLPVQRPDPEASDVPGEGHQPPLAYLLALPAVLWLPPDERYVTLTSDPAFRWNDGTGAAAFMRSSNEYWPWQGVTLAWHLARAVSTLLGALTVYCVWGAACTIFAPSDGPPRSSTRRWLPLLAAALVAFNPQFLFTAALVTNDMLLAALSAGIFWLCVAGENREPRTENRDLRTQNPVPSYCIRSCAVGGLFGLALLTKQSALLLVPLLVWFSWRIAGGDWRRMVGSVLIWGGVTSVLAGWWFGRNWLLYGDPMGLAKFQATYATQPFEWQSSAAWASALAQLYASFWARFGWLSLPAPNWVLGLYGGLLLLALCHRLDGLAQIFSAPRHPIQLIRVICGKMSDPGFAVRGSRFAVRRPWFAAWLLVVSAFAWTMSFALVAGLVAWQGRMLFPALAGIALLLTRELWQSGKAVRWPGCQAVKQALLLACLGLFVCLALFLPFGVIAPAYTWYTLPAVVAQERVVHQVNARYARDWERGVELRGWRISQQGKTIGRAGVQAGAAISVTLTWHALERVPEDWTVFVHLVDAAGVIVAEHNSRPQGGQMPMPLWTPGDWIEDQHQLVLPADLPTGSYTLRVGLYLPWQRDPRQGRRQEVWAADGSKLGDMAEVGIIQVRQASTVAE